MARFEEGAVVLASQGVRFWESKVLKVQSIGGVAQYLVHYQGWNKKFDEWVTDDRVMEATAENIKMAQEMRAKADAEEATRKKQTGGKKKAAAGSAEVGAAAGASASALSGEKRKSVDVVKETEEDPAQAPQGSGPLLKFTMLPPLKKQLVDDWDRVARSNKLVQVPKPAGFHTAGSTLDAYKLHLHQSQQVGSGSMAAAVSPAAPSGKRSRKEADGEGAGSSSASSSSAAAGASGAAGSVYATPESVIAALKPFERAATVAGVKAALDAIDGLRLYFNRALPMYLLYRFERVQFDAWHRLTHSAAYKSAADAGTSPKPDDYASVYGPEHLLRLFVKLPELLAHITLTDDEAKVLQTTVNDFLKFLAKHSATFFPRDHTLNYKPANDEYKAAWAASNAAPGASGSSAGAGRPKSVKDMDPRGLLGLPAAWPTASASSAATAVAR